MSEPLLRIRNLRVQFGTLVAVDDLSLELSGGQLLGMIGPNGAGKTTTLRAAAGLQSITTGQVEILGQDVFRHTTRVGQHLGFVPDTPALYDTLTVEKFLEFIGRCYALRPSQIQERIDMWLEHLWLADKRKARIATLSRGMKQRLAVARTLLPDPHVVLLDEPAAGLDPAGRLYFRRLLANLRDQGKAIIVSSHILADLADYCTHILIMERGRVLKLGTVAEVAGQGHTRCSYHIALAHAVGDAHTRLQSFSGVSDVRCNGTAIELEFERDPRAASELLRKLLNAGLPVSAFGPAEIDLEEAYLRTGIGQVD